MNFLESEMILRGKVPDDYLGTDEFKDIHLKLIGTDRYNSVERSFNIRIGNAAPQVHKSLQSQVKNAINN